ncbi:hypothetical protein V6N13_125344, partial [Hibiscus sabdariffa]
NQGGRPSDEVVIVDVPIALERQGSPVSLALQPTQKKGRSVEELMMVEDTPIEAMQDASGQTSGSTPGMVHPDEIVQPPNIPSFKDKLMGNHGFSKQA